MYDYAFGDLENPFGIYIRVSKTLIEKFKGLPSKINEVLREINEILKRFNVGTLLPFQKMNYGERCQIFLKSWLTIAESNLNIEKAIEEWEKTQENTIPFKDPHYLAHRLGVSFDSTNNINILIGKPENEEGFKAIKDFWKFYLERNKNIDIEKLGRLFNTDLKCLNEEDKCPIIITSHSKPWKITPSYSIFKRSLIIKKAYEENKNKSEIDKIIFNLRSKLEIRSKP
jgi:hypothetical protein